MKYTAGFVGAGNMGGALAKAACASVGAEKIAVSCKTIQQAQEVAQTLGCNYCTSSDVVRESRFVFLGVKPQGLKDVASDLRDDFDANSDCITVSMLAGVEIRTLEEMLGRRKIIRIMPNTPCTVGMGMVQYCKNDLVTDDDISEFKKLMSKSGMLDELDEGLIDAACAVSGCGPAFAYMFIEALSKGGVKCGLPREKAVMYAAQMLAGSAEMVLQTKKHPDTLKDEVCSPGGSTIEGVKSLEKDGFGACVTDAVEASFNRTKELGK